MPVIPAYVAIPALDFERAFAFYSSMTDGGLVRNPHVPFPMAWFQSDGEPPTGHLFSLPGFLPSQDGAIVYIRRPEPMEVSLERILAAGGTFVMPRTPLGPGKGFWSLFLDPEGNRLALHAIS